MLEAIATHLSAPNPRDALASLFCEVLHWDQPRGVSFTCTVTVRQGEEALLTLVPVAQLNKPARPPRGLALHSPALDAVVFDALDLTQGERDAVYEAVVNMVEARLHKAQSLR